MKKVRLLVMSAVLSIFGEAFGGATEMAINLIARYEGFRPTPYICPGGQKSIGYGFTDSDLLRKGRISQMDATRVLRKKVIAILDQIDREFMIKFTNTQRAALCSFIYNVGKSKWSKSTLKRLIIDKASPDTIKAEFKRWHYSQGVSLDGLEERRAAEAALWR